MNVSQNWYAFVNIISEGIAVDQRQNVRYAALDAIRPSYFTLVLVPSILATVLRLSEDVEIVGRLPLLFFVFFVLVVIIVSTTEEDSVRSSELFHCG